jgi:hypothetical protein
VGSRLIYRLPAPNRQARAAEKRTRTVFGVGDHGQRAPMRSGAASQAPFSRASADAALVGSGLWRIAAPAGGPGLRRLRIDPVGQDDQAQAHSRPPAAPRPAAPQGRKRSCRAGGPPGSKQHLKSGEKCRDLPCNQRATLAILEPLRSVARSSASGGAARILHRGPRPPLPRAAVRRSQGSASQGRIPSSGRGRQHRMVACDGDRP